MIKRCAVGNVLCMVFEGDVNRVEKPSQAACGGASELRRFES